MTFANFRNVLNEIMPVIAEFGGEAAARRAIDCYSRLPQTSSPNMLEFEAGDHQFRCRAVLHDLAEISRETQSAASSAGAEARYHKQRGAPGAAADLSGQYARLSAPSSVIFHALFQKGGLGSLGGPETWDAIHFTAA